MNWQPIETAPRAGRFLVWGGNWVGEINGREPSEQIVLVNKSFGQFIVADTDCYTATIDKPTHWMPLPEPPTCA